MKDTFSHSNALYDAWQDLKQRQKRIRARDAASQLGVSEAALVATLVGRNATRLAGNYGDLLAALPGVGTVMVLTRNEYVVHEKVGCFGNVSIQPGGGLVLNHDVDLRLFMNHWRHAFEIRDPLDTGGTRRSLQFFDAEGMAVHKVFARPETDIGVWQALVDTFTAPQQSSSFSPLHLPPAPDDLPDTDIDVEGLRAHWRDLQDTHEFFGMLKDFRVGRQQAMRLAGPEFVQPVQPAAARAMLETAATRNTPIMCFVGNRGCIQIHTGPVETIKIMGPWLNVLDPGFNLHLREDAIRSAYIVRKPTRDGDVTSLELFDPENRNMVMFFGERKPGESELESWRQLLGDLPRTS